ncbi:MAG: hypothetical protein J1F63_00625 [Oscillospiraceae bacterium]|nr:hypothetical protein [Oscillospiraceae bacterium]
MGCAEKSAFGCLVLETCANIGKKKKQAVIASAGLSIRSFTPKKLHKNPHRLSWAYKVSEVLNIRGDIAYRALLSDLELDRIGESELVFLAPNEYLYSYRFYGLAIRWLMIEIERMKTNEDITDLKETIARAKDLLTKQNSVAERLENLDITETQKAVLRAKFFDSLTDKEIAKTFGYDLRYIYRLQAKGLETLKNTGVRP